MLKLLSFKHLVRTTAYLRHVPSLPVSGVWKSVYHAAKQQQLTNNRVSPSPRPPPAFFNRPYNHRRHYSAGPELQQAYQSWTGHNDENLRQLVPQLNNLAVDQGCPVHGPMATTEPLIPCLLVPLGPAKPVAIYHPRDHEFVMRTQRASAKMQQITDAHANLLPLSYMSASAMNIVPTPRPTGPPPGIPRSMPPPMPPPAPATMERPTLQVHHKRQNSSSSVSSTGSSIVWGRESFESRHQSPSLSSSRTSLDSLPPYSSGSRSPSSPHYQLKGYPWQRPAPIKTVRRQMRPGELFSLLPGDVLELILQELRALHIRDGGDSCETCWMRDCCAVALSGRKFVKYAREALYQHIYLVGDEGPQMKKRMKMEYGCRLTLLRRTLRVNNQIAVIVRSIKPPARPVGVGSVEYNDLVASVVMACPNLERLVGFYPGHDHSFQRLFQALSTRKRLKDMSWILEPAKTHRVSGGDPLRRSRRRSFSQSRSQSITPVGESFQSFPEFHLNWRNLTTLGIHGQPGATLAPGALEQALWHLPSLQTLHVSSLPSESFNDGTLALLPPLKKLTLSRLRGVTTAGLSAFATRAASTKIQTLTLHHMNIETLPALARLFSNLPCLDTFNLCQVYAPIMPTDELVWLFPYLASPSLRRLHWDIPYLPTRATTADRILAESIRAGGFPALRALRAPNDPKGIFQALCRPRGRISDALDRHKAAQDWGHGHSSSSPQLGRGLVHHARSASSDNRPQHHARSMSGTSLSTSQHPSPPASLDALMMPRDNSDLHQARLAAQARLEDARRYPRYCIDVIDVRGRVVEKYPVGAFLGTAGSRISYVLTPDEGGTDEGGGLVGIADMLRDGGEMLVVPRPEVVVERSWRSRKGEGGEGERRVGFGCCGGWNKPQEEGGYGGEKKGREGGWAAHVERGRWKGVVLS